MALQIKGGHDGLTYFNIEGPAATKGLCVHLAEQCVSFYFEPQCFDERTIVVNGAAAHIVERYLIEIEVPFNSQRI